MQSALISETLRAEAVAKRKRALNVKPLGVAGGSNGSSVRATRRANKSHGGRKDHRGGFCDLLRSTHLPNRG